MADEPSPRAIWNVKVAVNGLILLAAGGLMWYGVTHDSLTVKEALQMLGSAAFGSGVTWMTTK